MKNLLLTVSILIFAISSVSCQTTRDTTIVINVITNDTLNTCAGDTVFIHYIINEIPIDTVCNPVIIEDTTGSVTGSILLKWEGGDPDGDAVTYDLYFGVAQDPPLYIAGLSASQCVVQNIKYGTKYYWRVVAKDSNNAVTSGPVWNFTTEVKL